MYIELDINYNLSFADTASGDDLSRRTAEFGVNREPATPAHREGRFYGAGDVLMDVPIGGRYSINDVNYVVSSKISTGVFSLECETAGTIGNQYFGTLLPIQFVAGLSRADLGAVLVPGDDEETDDALRTRYYEEVNNPSFGGNVADYKQTIGRMDGVGGVKVYPVWQGGGTVKCTIIASDWSIPSAPLVAEVQTAMDPTVNSGTGIGMAPIGHKVTIAGVSAMTVNTVTTVTLASGTTVGQVQAPIETAIGEYMLGLRKSWAGQEQLVVRVALIEAAILTVPGVVDVTGTTLNGSAANLTLGQDQIPMRGTVTING
ncbi:baseplate J/gp47 family protein [Cohnella thailandensis]